MGISKIKAAGANADLLGRAADNMNSIYNEHRTEYEGMLVNIKAVYGQEKTMSTLTDAEINAFFFNDLGDEQALAEAKSILGAWENAMNGLAACVLVLPPNI